MERKLVQLSISAAFDMVSNSGLLYKLRSISVGGQFLFIVSGFLSDRRQRVRLDRKVSALVNVVSGGGGGQGSVLRPLLFIFYTSKLFRIVGNHIMGYADGAMIYAVLPRPLSRPQVVESLNLDLAATYSWCVKWYMRLNPKKTRSMVVNRSHANAPGYCDLTHGGAELKEVKSLRIPGICLS